MIIQYISDKSHGTLTQHKYYNVYGLRIRQKNIEVLICEDNYDGVNTDYPVFIGLDFFSVADNSLSMIWTTKILKKEDGFETLIGVNDIINNDSFIDNILFGKEPELKVFKKYKQIIDKECLTYYNH